MRRDRDERETTPPVGGDPRVDGAWRALELPTPAPAPPGFAARVTARAKADERRAFELPLAPAWARVAAVLALVAGIVGGAGLGLAGGTATSAEGDPDPLAWSGSSFAEELVDGLDAALTAESTETP